MIERSSYRSNGSRNSPLVLALILITGIIFAIDKYENEASASNIVVDINGGGDYFSIQDALDHANDGDTIYVWAGTYNEQIRIEKPVNLFGNGSTETIIDGNGGGDWAVSIHSDDVLVDGFTIANSITNITNGFHLDNVEDVQIVNNTIVDQIKGIELINGCNSNIIGSNVIHSNKNHGIFIQQSPGNRIISNKCQNNWGAGITLSGFSYSNEIAFNNCSKNNVAISIRNSGMNQVHDNTILNNYDVGIEINSGSSLNEFIHNNIIDNTQQANDQGSGNLWGNETVGGNFWDDYLGEDNGNLQRIAGDGIGDLNVPHLDLDYYPYVLPNGWLLPGTPQVLDPGNIDEDGVFNISWEMPHRTASFILMEDTNASFGSPHKVYEGPELSCEVNDRSNGTYYFKLRALNELGLSKWSSVVDIVVEYTPIPPPNFHVVSHPEGGENILSWKSTPNVTRYDFQFKTQESHWQQLPSIAPTQTSYVHANLKNGEKYYYRIRAVSPRNQMSEWSAVIMAVPLDSQPPDAPENVSIEHIFIDGVVLDWDPNDEADLGGYNIYRCQEPGSDDWGCPLNGPIPHLEDRYYDTDANENNSYFYVVTAVDEVPNESTRSNMVNATIPIGPNCPEIMAVKSDISVLEDKYDATSINLHSWFKDINGDELEFRCEGNRHIKIQIFNGNGTVIIEPEMNWNGQEILTFYASDGDCEIFDTIRISIIPSNDPPGPIEMISPRQNVSFEYGSSLDLEAQCDDPDIPYGDTLIFKWSSDVVGDIGFGKELTDIFLPCGEHIITLNVTDRHDRNSIAAMKITVRSPNSTLTNISDPENPNRDSTDDTIEKQIKSGSMIWIQLEIVVIVVLGLISFVLSLLIRKLKHKPGEPLDDMKGGSEKRDDPENVKSNDIDGPSIVDSNENGFAPSTRERTDLDDRSISSNIHGNNRFEDLRHENKDVASKKQTSNKNNIIIRHRGRSEQSESLKKRSSAKSSETTKQPPETGGE